MYIFPTSFFFWLGVLWVSGGLTMLFTLHHTPENRWPGPRLQFIVQGPIVLVGSLMYLSVALTLLAGESLHGLWLILLTSGGLHIGVMNALIICYADNDSIVAKMVSTKLIKKDDQANFPSGPKRLVQEGR